MFNNFQGIKHSIHSESCGRGAQMKDLCWVSMSAAATNPPGWVSSFPVCSQLFRIGCVHVGLKQQDTVIGVHWRILFVSKSYSEDIVGCIWLHCRLHYSIDCIDCREQCASMKFDPRRSFLSWYVCSARLSTQSMWETSSQGSAADATYNEDTSSWRLGCWCVDPGKFDSLWRWMSALTKSKVCWPSVFLMNLIQGKPNLAYLCLIFTWIYRVLAIFQRTIITLIGSPGLPRFGRPRLLRVCIICEYMYVLTCINNNYCMHL